MLIGMNTTTSYVILVHREAIYKANPVRRVQRSRSPTSPPDVPRTTLIEEDLRVVPTVCPPRRSVRRPHRELVREERGGVPRSYCETRRIQRKMACDDERPVTRFRADGPERVACCAAWRDEGGIQVVWIYISLQLGESSLSCGLE